MGIPKVLYQETKQDAWIVIILSGLILSFILLIMIYILKKFNDKDLFQIHGILFGEIIGKIINTILILYFLSAFYSIMSEYIELVISWGNEGVYYWFPAFVLIVLSIYGVFGGVKVVAGICFITFWFTFWLILLLPLTFDHFIFERIAPIFNTPVVDIGQGMLKTTYSLLGFECILFIYPFVKDKTKVFRFALLGMWFTLLLMLSLTIVSILFFSPNQLKHTIWPILNMMSIVRVPFIEIFEYIAVSFWILIIYSNLTLFLWIASKGIKRVFKLRQKKGVYVSGILIFILSFVINDRDSIEKFSDFVNYFGFCLWICYPIFLFLITKVKKV